MKLGIGLGIPYPNGINGISPASLFAAGEQGVWYDPSDMSTLFQDAAGTTPLTAVEQPVGLMLDKSGRGNHATQTTATSRPILKQDVGGQYYLLFDGIDDSMVTSTITPGTDKAQVFAGVRFVTLSTIAVIFELSANVNSNSGTFLLFVNSDSTPRFRSKGSIYSQAAGPVLSSPSTRVLTGLGDISGDLATLRVDGTQAATSTADQGTDNYLAYPLYIGRRGGASLPLDGNFYGGIVRFGPNLTEQQITQTEQWVNSKTGAY